MIYPGDRLLSLIYERQKEQKRAALMPAVGVIASVQACEALKIAAGKKCALQGKLFCADLLNSEFECIPFS